jgi:hypothetical protein
MKQILFFLLPLLLGCSGSSTWKFSAPPSTLVITQRLVVQQKQPILYVIHTSEGDWRFLADATLQLDPVMEVSIRDLVAIDSTIIDIAYLKKGWSAWRADKASPWNSSVYK